LTLLQELSGCPDNGNPRLLLACEEPELYQHPPQARHLSAVLQRLAKSNAQVLVSTHSPYFVSGRGFQAVRVIRQDLIDDQPCVRSVTFDQLSQKLAEALGEDHPIPSAMEFKVEQALQPGLNEMFFSPVLILTEGLEDTAYLTSYLALTERAEEFHRLGCHIVATSGKGSMVAPLAIAKMLDIPTFVIFDADGDCSVAHRPQHERDNLALMRLSGVNGASAFPAAIFEAGGLMVWPTEIGDTIKSDFGADKWLGYKERARQKRRIADVPDLNKNVLFIGHVLTEAYGDGAKSQILESLCSKIISFARSARAAEAREAGPVAAVAD